MAKDACYSNARYVYVDEHGVGHLIYGRSFVGVSHDYKNHVEKFLREPPVTRARIQGVGTSRDVKACSVKGGPHRPTTAGPGENASVMYVFYEHYQVYPEFIVSYHV